MALSTATHLQAFDLSSSFMTLNGRRHFHNEMMRNLGRAYIWAAAVLVFKIHLEQLCFFFGGLPSQEVVLINSIVLPFYV
jgi:hypothetical protein